MSDRASERVREKSALYDEGAVGAVFVQEVDSERALMHVKHTDACQSYLACVTQARIKTLRKSACGRRGSSSYFVRRSGGSYPLSNQQPSQR